MVHHSRRSRHRCRGLTLAEVILIVGGVAIMLIFVVGMLMGILLPSLSRAREVANRAVCSSNMRSVHQAMYAYGATQRGAFPLAGHGTEDGHIVGFKDGPRHGPTPPRLDDNVTANLWITVRVQATVPKTFICPSDTRADPDALTDSAQKPVPLAHTFDFARPENLSFSPMNMYHAAQYSRVSGIAGNWSQDCRPDWVLVGDNNNNADPDRHNLAKTQRAPEYVVRRTENSQVHSAGEGQNFLMGDGSVSFENDPFVGPAGDNALAMTRDGRNRPPTLRNNDGDISLRTDCFLIPVTGNAGDNLAGH